jgi:protein SCO1/2
MQRAAWASSVIIGCAALVGFGAALLWQRESPALPALTEGQFVRPRTPLPEFDLIDHHGRPFTRAALSGHWTLLYFGYTNCPDLCPATLASLAAMQKRLPASAASSLEVVFVSVDARRDTPAQLAGYVPYFDPGFVGVTATDQPRIEAFAAKLGIAVAINPQTDGSYTVDHSSAILVVDPTGRLAAVLTGPFTVDALRTDFLRISSAAS